MSRGSAGGNSSPPTGAAISSLTTLITAQLSPNHGRLQYNMDSPDLGRKACQTRANEEFNWDTVYDYMMNAWKENLLLQYHYSLFLRIDPHRILACGSSIDAFR